MGAKLELQWEGYWQDGLPAFKLDEDLEKVVECYGMIHEMWREKEKARFEDHRADVDATPFEDEDLRVVEYAFRLAVARIEVALKERDDLQKQWSTARKFHWKHKLEMAEHDAEDDIRDEEQIEVSEWRMTGPPLKMKDGKIVGSKRGFGQQEILGPKDKVPDLVFGERIRVCECDLLAKKVKRKSKRIARLSRVVGFIRQALYIRGQYRTGIQVSEWTESQMPKMKLLLDAEPCPCLECERTEKKREWVRTHNPDGTLKRERDEFSKLLRRTTKPYTWAQQERDMKREARGEQDKKKQGTVFGAPGSLKALFGKK